MPNVWLVGKTLLVSGLLLAAIETLGTVYPTEETKSRFLADYNPSAVLRRLEPDLSSGGGISSSAGGTLPWQHHDITYDAEFRWSWPPDNLRPGNEIGSAWFRRANRIRTRKRYKLHNYLSRWKKHWPYLCKLARGPEGQRFGPCLHHRGKRKVPHLDRAAALIQ